jgi:hypothetical protein
MGGFLRVFSDNRRLFLGLKIFKFLFRIDELVSKEVVQFIFVLKM